MVTNKAVPPEIPDSVIREYTLVWGKSLVDIEKKYWPAEKGCKILENGKRRVREARSLRYSAREQKDSNFTVHSAT